MPPRSTQVGYSKLAAHKSRRYDYLKSSVGKTKLEFDLLRSITLRIKNRGAEDTEKLFDVSPVASVAPRFNSYTTGWLLKRIGLSKSNYRRAGRLKFFRNDSVSFQQWHFRWWSLTIPIDCMNE